MDVYMVILRLLHIFAGIMWVGFALFMAMFTAPVLGYLQERGGTFIHALYRQTTFLRAMPVVAVITTLAGILLYLRVSDNFNADWLGSPGGLVMTVGAVAGILAFGHGATTIGPLQEKTAKVLDQMTGADGPPAPEQVAELQGLTAKVSRHSSISLVLMIIAVIGMAAHRYM